MLLLRHRETLESKGGPVMGTISINRLGGLSLILGPLLALSGYFLQPGGMLIEAANPADAQAVIAAAMGNPGFMNLTMFMVPIGLVIFLYGMIALQMSTREDGNGDALTRYSVLFFFLAVIGWSFTAAMANVIASDIGATAGTVYAMSLGVGSLASIFGGLAALFFGLAFSGRDDSNKIFALLLATSGAVGAITAIIGGVNPSQLQTMNMIGGLTFIIGTVWFISRGIGLIKKG